MRKERILLHVYGEHQDAVWTLTCLDLSFSSSATELMKAKEYVRANAHEYLEGKLVGENIQFPAIPVSAGDVSRRKMKYWLARTWQHFDGRTRGHIYDEVVGLDDKHPMFS
ncbi:hypothetical protein PHO31112_03161 [Pandoraea horticolens]|uniref:DUF1902 domain-containing protein n=1 Tax=Pandoraea horticolens TaxID=2508298 RepID=A0A5E4WAQ2_9BURK|nr:hypothetical protein [Pandoraea horticolens]VVE21648.1 hypothetical protein PHO31112_03161 [Pandoraea horticolens]